MTTDSPQVVFHIDMDAFYASIEQRDNPPYAGKPLIVGALPGHRGVVSTASYEARAFGIHSAMPIGQAYRRCPHGIYVKPNMPKYVRESKAVMDILARFSPSLEQVSVDEAFIDMTGTQRLFGSPLAAASSIGDTIRTERRLTASIGIAPNKFLAKIASDLHKPDGITEAPLHIAQAPGWLAPLAVGRMWGVGRKTDEMLRRLGIRTIGDLQGLTREYLSQRFGKAGGSLYELSRGRDARMVNTTPEAAKSISREHTFGSDSRNRDEWERVLLTLSQDVARRARKGERGGRTVVLIYRMSDFQKHTRRLSLTEPTTVANRIFEYARALLEHIPHGAALRLIGVGLTGFDEAVQGDLFAQPGRDSWKASEKAIDALEERFGRRTIVRGREVDSCHTDTDRRLPKRKEPR